MLQPGSAIWAHAADRDLVFGLAFGLAFCFGCFRLGAREAGERRRLVSFWVGVREAGERRHLVAFDADSPPAQELLSRCQAFRSTEVGQLPPHTSEDGSRQGFENHRRLQPMRPRVSSQRPAR